MKIRPEFKVHRLNEEGLAKAEGLAKSFSDFLTHLEAQLGTSGREMSIVRTKLQEASFYAKRALAENPAHQEEGKPEVVVPSEEEPPALGQSPGIEQ